jgi:hypothetical protein
LTAAPAVECFNATLTLAEPAPGEEPAETGLAGSVALLREQVRQDTEDALVPLLQETYPQLVEMVRGARAAFEDRRPDWVRHFITSLRELATQVIHALAPDEQVKEWSTSPEDLHNGRPTRAARIKYICRGIFGPGFRPFVEKDVATAVELFGLLQGGTHGANPTYSEPQLLTLKVRMEGLVRFLVEIGRLSR